MRVLFVTYPKIGLGRGGLQIQIEKTANELRKLGIEVILFDPWRNQIDNVDLCHIFSLDASMRHHIQEAAVKGVPVITSPVFGCFQDPNWLTTFKVKLSKLPGMFSQLVIAKLMLKTSSKVLALTNNERDIFIRAFQVPAEKCLIVPNGIEKRFADGDPRLFEDRFGVSNFVLNAGAIDPNKNQLTLIKAMTGLPYKLVIVGQARLCYEDYAKKCQDIAGDNVVFTGQLNYDDPLLSSAFAAAKLFVLPSYSEVMPLALYEAAAAGCKLIASQNFPVAEEIAAIVPRVDPDKPRELAKLIKREMATPCNPRLREIVLNMPSWADVAQMIKGIYEEVMREKRRTPA